MATLKLWPARPDLIVRDPASGVALPADGKSVPRDTYWLRRMRDGDAVEARPGGKARPAAKPPTTPES